MRPARRHSALQAGITLIEIMIVLAVIGLLALLLPRQIRQARKSELRGDASRIAAAMRSGYDRAAATAAHHRLIIDLDEDTFQLERCEGPVRMVRSIDEAQAQEAQSIAAQLATPPEAPPPIDPTGQTPNPSAPGALGGPQVDDEVGASGAPLPCTPVKGALGKPQTLAGSAGIKFKQVFVAHLEQPAGEGKVTINFFPLGRGERAVVTLIDAEDHVYSVRLHALTGRAQISEGEYRRPEDLVNRESEEESSR
jgi:prepilin-type N-terminal cleavage/methylation domain-containing protein